MPLTAYVCPDGASIPVLECLTRCRMERRCLSLPTLRRCAVERRGDKFSVTQLLNGTMLEYLTRTVDYSISPKSRAFALLGQVHHSELEDYSFGDTEASEVSLSGFVEGHPDLLEVDQGGRVTLWDYKTWGSYRVSRFLGLTYELVDDPSGATYERDGKWGKRGTPKQVKVWHPNPLVADTTEATLQLNAYRMLLAPLHIDEMRLQVTVRDGGLAVARDSGITELIYTFDVERMPDDAVAGYFIGKSDLLHYALTSGWREPCLPSERWHDRRCKSYCDVAFACEYGKTLKEVPS